MAHSAGSGAILVFLRARKSRTDSQLKTISDDDWRNILIVETGFFTGHSGPALQALSNLDLVRVALGGAVHEEVGRRFELSRSGSLDRRLPHQADHRMLPDDQRNTLITELAHRSNQPGGHFQAMDDHALAGAGAVLVFLRAAKIRTDSELKTISDDDWRNILIVETATVTQHSGPELQGLNNLTLVLVALGMPIPKPPVVPAPPPLRPVREFDRAPLRTPDGLAIKGSAHLVVTEGAFTFSGTARDSGATNIDYTVAAVLTASGIAVTFAHQGSTEGTIAGLPFGTPSRDDSFTVTDSKSLVAANGPTSPIGLPTPFRRSLGGRTRSCMESSRP